MRHLRWLGITAVLISFVAASAAVSEAQMRPGQAQVTQSTGRVEVLRKSQQQWGALAAGARLAEGDQVRSFAAGSAELALPDGSTILVAENTRYVLTKLDYDATTKDRNMAGHVVAGKVRAQVARVAVQLIRARVSNFNISTPNGVAAVRGTITVVFHNPATGQTLVASFPSPGQSPAQARVDYISAVTQQVQQITGGNYITQVGTQNPTAPTSIQLLPPGAQQALQTSSNQATQNSPALVAVIVAILTPQQVEQIVQAVAAQLGTTVTVQEGTLTTTDVAGCASPPCN